MKEKIAICTNSLRIGGTERVVSILLNHLRDVFHIHLILYNDQVEYKIPAGVEVFHLAQSSNEGSFSMLMKGPVLSYRLNRYLKKNSITTLVAFLNRGCYLSALARKLFRYKGTVVMCQRTHQSTLVSHGSYTYRIFSNAMLRWCLEAADRVLANSLEIKNDLQNFLPANLTAIYIPNPIDLDEISQLADYPVSLMPDNNSFNFVSLGGLRPEKDHVLLLDAFSLLKSTKANLWIVGGGRLEQQLRKRAENLDISSSVIFFGSQDNPFPFLKKSDCLVLASRVEGFPNALLEGLACGKAVIATDCMSGPREILAPGSVSGTDGREIEFAESGILVPVHNATLLAKAMQEMMTNRNMREQFSRNAAAAIKKFGIVQLKDAFVRAFSSSPIVNR